MPLAGRAAARVDGWGSRALTADAGWHGMCRSSGMSAASKGPRLLDRVRVELRVRHYSPRTAEAYVGWVKRFVRFHGLKHPLDLDDGHRGVCESFGSRGGASRLSTQNQALAALLFLYTNVLGRRPGSLGEFVHAKRSERLPVVLNTAEVTLVLARMEGMPRLMASLLYGSGLRLMECAQVAREGRGSRAR